MKETTKANLGRVFCIIIGIIALFPIGAFIIRGKRVELNVFGFVSLIIYLSAVFLRKRTLAGWSFCFVALYFFITDFTDIPFSFTSFYLVSLVVTALAFVIKMGILSIGYVTLCPIDEQDADFEEKNKKLKVNCPKCGYSLKGATQVMIGDVGICAKCRAEFVIGQISSEDN